MAALQSRTGLEHGFQSGLVCRHREHPEPVKTKTLAMNRLRPGRFVSRELAIKGGLRRAFAHHGHCSAISLKEEVCALATAALIGKFQSKSPIRNDPELRPAREIHPPSKQ